jgi:glycerophosphoryl diester phosphodiesterase
MVGCPRGLDEAPCAPSGRRQRQPGHVIRRPCHGVEVVGHRGASADTPEHTLAAYEDAVRIGADAVECDVRMTRDGVLVCVHDRRIDRTSSGRGVVSELTLAQLEQHRFGHRRPRRISPEGLRSRSRSLRTTVTDEADRDAGGVLTLHTLLDYVTSTPGHVGLAIETKHPTRYSGLVETTLVNDLRRFGLLSGDRPLVREGRPAVRVMSFSSTALSRMRQMAPRLPTVQLAQRLPPRPRLESLLRNNPVFGPGLSLLRRHPDLVRRAHAAGTAVHVWTVNAERDLDFVVGLGVDAVITDRPGVLLDRLGRSAGGRDAG